MEAGRVGAGAVRVCDADLRGAVENDFPPSRLKSSVFSKRWENDFPWPRFPWVSSGTVAAAPNAPSCFWTTE